MKTIKNNNNIETIVKNSKFICYLYSVQTKDDINNALKHLKKEYSDSTHICYAYRLENQEKAFDDGEPSGTAGAPILEVLKKNDLYNVLAVVIRYFGGTLLGAGGLIRAYSKSVREALTKTTLVDLIYYNFYRIESSYDDLKLLNKLTKDLDIIEKEYGETIVYKIKINKDIDNIEEIFKNTNIKVEIFV